MYSVVIIGGGIVGLATALRLKLKSPSLKIALLDKEKALAVHQTGHNSGVIHSGIYYKPGSYKAKNCVDGYNQLIKFCNEEEIPYEICGKIIVATKEDQLPQLDMLQERGTKNGLIGIKKLSDGALKEYEPNVLGLGGLFVPQTGIINYKVVADKYAEIIRHFNGEIHPSTEALKVTFIKNKIVNIQTNKKSFNARVVVNCAGLFADKMAKIIGGRQNFRIIPFRGEYYKLKNNRKHLVKNLIYPVPDPNFPFLGVHFTRMINGDVEAGPNAVFSFKKEGYSKMSFKAKETMDSLTWPGFQIVMKKYWKTGLGEIYRSFSKAAFTKALQQLVPEIKSEDLISAEAGVRAQACDKNGGLIEDFLINEGESYVNVCNAPSPAATSSLSIGDHVSDLVLSKFK